MPFLTDDEDGNMRIPGSKSLIQALNCTSDSFVDFVRQCLEWDPAKRMSPFDALMHDWIIEGLPPEVLITHK